MVNPMRLNIGFVSTRFAGIDGVSLESSKWARVLEHEGHACFWFAGELAKSEHISLQARQAHFKDDIEPRGFDLVKMDGTLSAEVITDIQNIIHNKARREKMVAANYRLASKHYSYAALRKQFVTLISNLFPHHGFPPQKCSQAATGN